MLHINISKIHRNSLNKRILNYFQLSLEDMSTLINRYSSIFLGSILTHDHVEILTHSLRTNHSLSNFHSFIHYQICLGLLKMFTHYI